MATKPSESAIAKVAPVVSKAKHVGDERQSNRNDSAQSVAVKIRTVLSEAAVTGVVVRQAKMLMNYLHVL